MELSAPAPGEWPDLTYEGYRSAVTRGPRQPAVPIRIADPGVPSFAATPPEADLTAMGAGPPLGERIAVVGRVLDEGGRPVRRSLIELWQCNAAGRYRHRRDQHDAPLDPNFAGFGKTLTDDDGRYRFVTIKPGAYPWGNHSNAWRPAHLHVSLFGSSYAQRLVTQMYFPGDPLLALDPIFHSVADELARSRLVSRFSLADSVEGRLLGYTFDIVLRGRDATPMDP